MPDTDIQEAFVFVRRTPKALNFHPSRSRPMNVRLQGKSRINYKRMDRGDRFDSIARGVMSSIRRFADRRTLTVNLEHVAAGVTFEGYDLEFVPGSPMFRECIRIRATTEA